MVRFAAILRCSLAAAAAASGFHAGEGKESHWAVLIAGSKEFWNYRHQADVCHAYHVLLARGFHPERIITMMYDDVAQAKENPFHGKLYNFPWKTRSEAVDVYAGCKIDYRGHDVTPDKFVAVLTGDAQTAGGRVLQSKAGDHVFVNFVDHGATGLIAFPADDTLHAKRLISTIQTMYQHGMFKQLVFYLETCESGSMFEGILPTGLPVYAVTAANSSESSWGTYCGTEAVVAGVPLKTCLGDLFSVSWMRDSDAGVHKQETLASQFSKVKRATNQSHVMRFGDFMHIGPEQVSDFQGTHGEEASAVVGDEDREDLKLAQRSAVDSRDSKLEYLHAMAYGAASDSAAAEALRLELEERAKAFTIREKLLSTAVAAAGGERPAGAQFWTEELLDCHARAAEIFGAACGWSEARLMLSRTLYDLCVASSSSAEPVVAAVAQVCPPVPVDFWM